VSGGFEPDLLARALAARATALARLAGQRDALRAREAELRDAVGRAKGRLALRPDVEALLDRLQAAAHERAVGVFERLLTGIVGDVLPGERRIVLDLGTERGLPALDIAVEREGWREGIIDGSGGSLTNVVSAGLRFAALVRSPRRRFVALDEPDCWLAPDRVPAFTGVVARIAREVAVQALLISHHDPALFEGQAFVVRLGWRAGRLAAVPDSAMPSWGADQPGLRRIRLIDFMSHEDTELPLAPGVTTILGANNLGKSAVLSALRAVAYGGSSDAVIRHGRPLARVEIEVEGGRRLAWERRRKGTPKMVWQRLAPDGRVELETAPGRDVPDWATEMLGIAPLDEIDVQLGHQKQPIFILDQPPRSRAQILSVGRESGHLAAMLSLYRDDLRADAETVRRGEAELAGLLERLAGFADLDGAGAALEVLSEDLRQLVRDANDLAALSDTMDELAGLRDRCAVLAAQGEALAGLPEPPDPPADDIERTAERLAELAGRLDILRQSLAALEDLPAEPPAAEDVAPLVAAIAALRQAELAEAAARSTGAAVAGELAASTAALKSLIDRLGNACPLCGQSIEADDHFLEAGHG